MTILKNLLEYYIEVEGLAGEVIVDVLIEDDNLVIEVNKGFHCLFIPLAKIKEVITK